jgi:hypothetical protein
MFEEMRMPYEAIPTLIFLTISLLSGLGLIGDALRRAIHDMRRGDHDLHPQQGPKLDLAARRPVHSVGKVVAIQGVGGLHHRAERRVA